MIIYVIVLVIIILPIKLYNVWKRILVQKTIINYNKNVINVLHNVHMMNSTNIFMMVLIIYNVFKIVIQMIIFIYKNNNVNSIVHNNTFNHLHNKLMTFNVLKIVCIMKLIH